MGSTILKNDFEYVRSKISLVWPPNGITMSRFCHYCSLLLLCCSFGSLCVRFLPPSKTACSSTPVLFSPPNPFCRNDAMHSTCHFMNFVCNSLFSLCMSCFAHPFLQLVCHLFWKFASRPRWEHDFQKCMNVKSCQKQLLRPSNRTDYTYFGAVYGTWISQNRWEKCVFLVYVPSLEALFAPMCSTACILHEIYIFSPCFRHDFASKLTLLSEATSHKYVRLPLPARYVAGMPPWCL